MPTQARADCTSPVAPVGKIIYNSAQKNFQYCANTTWVAMHALGGSGSGGCTSPARIEGALIYNEAQGMLQGCAGNVWIGLSSPPGGDAGNPNGFVQIDSGSDESCGIKGDGSLWCWGIGNYGALGDGPSYGYGHINSTPTRVLDGAATGSKWTQVAVGGDFACGIRDNGAAFCWGYGGNGRLGNGATTNQYSPVPVSLTSVTGTAWTWIGTNTSSSHVCAVRDDGTGYCWGLGSDGQMGNSTTTTTNNTPKLVGGSPTGTGWTKIEAGSAHSCGIRNDGTAWCWGYGGYGERGGGNFTATRTTPAAVVTTGVTGTAWTDIAVGEYDSCGIRNDGTGYCWGEVGPLGTNWAANNSTPQAVVTTGVTGTGWTKFNVGYDHGMGLRNDGSAYGFGENYYGNLGNGDQVDQGSPALVDSSNVGGTAWVGVAPGNIHSCALRNNGMVYCFGNNGHGQLGNSAIVNYRFSPTRVDASATTGTGWTYVSTSGSHSCGLRDNGTGWCWGSGDVGDDVWSPVYSPHVPIDLAAYSVTGTVWTALEAGASHGCGIRDNGTMWCWGSYGTVGDGTFNQEMNPKSVSLTGVTGSSWTKVASAAYFTCAIRDDGTGYCWGGGAEGEIGNGAASDADHPTAISTGSVTGTAWTQIDGGYQHACGLRDNGTAWCWGRDSNGQLGDGGSTQQNSPVAVSTTGVSGTNWTEISAGAYNTCGLRDDGTGWCWGTGVYGANGNNDTNNFNTPQAVTLTGVSGSSWSHIYSGPNMGCGIRDDGTAWCWGYNFYGSLGISSDAQSNVPVRVNLVGVGGSNWTRLSLDSTADNYSVCGLRDDNNIYCWGDGTYGNIGDAATGLTISALATGCSSPTGGPGKVIYNADKKRLQVCNGAGWVALAYKPTGCQGGAYNYTTPGMTTLVVPAGCDVASVEAWGAGGGGATGNSTAGNRRSGGGGGGSGVERASSSTVLVAAGGGGGAGAPTSNAYRGGGSGAYVINNNVSLTPAETLNIYVGGGGAGGCTSPTDANGAGGAYNGTAGGPTGGGDSSNVAAPGFGGGGGARNGFGGGSIYGGGGGNSGTNSPGAPTYGGTGGDQAAGFGATTYGGTSYTNGNNGSGATGGAGVSGGGYTSGAGGNGVVTCSTNGGDGRVRITFTADQ